MKILTAAQMGEVDRLSTDIYRIPSLLLMENAGRAVADAVEESIPAGVRKKVFVLCGKGNNGGDGFVAARYLSLRGGHPEILLFADPGQLKGDALTNYEIAQAMRIRTHALVDDGEARSFLRRFSEVDVVIDGLFGTGLTKPISGIFKYVVEWVRRIATRAFVLSVDIPSGLFADSAAVPGPAVQADLTVTFTALKKALFSPPASAHAGRVKVVPIGSPPGLLDNPLYRLESVDAPLIRPAIPRRPLDSHKGTFGHVYVVAGSRGKSGAALMTGLAALRCGAGLVTLWLPSSLQRPLAGKVPELMTEFVAETPEGSVDSAAADQILPKLRDADVLIVGPGLTTAPRTKALAERLVRNSTVPVVLDADGINAFASHPEGLSNDNGQGVVITPHPGEMARLLGTTISAVQKSRIECAEETSARHSIHTILKGYQTVIASPAGRILINTTGNPGMATGGSGDILAGMVGCFVGMWNRRRGANSLVTHLAAAVYLHGLAGDLAAEEKGMESMIATDLLPHLPDAFKRVTRQL